MHLCRLALRAPFVDEGLTVTRTVTGRVWERSRKVETTRDRADLVLSMFEKYYGRVYCFARQSLQAGQAEDIAQDVFLKLLQHSQLEGKTIKISYLLKIADNLIKRRYRRQQRFATYLERRGSEAETESDDCEVTAAGISEQLKADLCALDQAMAQLTEHEQDAVRLIVTEGLSYEAAAASLSVPVTTLNNWKYRGLRKLQELTEARIPDRRAMTGS